MPATEELQPQKLLIGAGLRPRLPPSLPRVHNERNGNALPRPLSLLLFFPVARILFG